jgi:hypothetical protein
MNYQTFEPHADLNPLVNEQSESLTDIAYENDYFYHATSSKVSKGQRHIRKAWYHQNPCTVSVKYLRKSENLSTAQKDCAVALILCTVNIAYDDIEGFERECF